jgi:hypothetical protein
MFIPLRRTSYLDEEVIGTEPSPSVRVPWSNVLAITVSQSEQINRR